MSSPSDEPNAVTLISPWLLVTQEMIDCFGKGTHDIDPMHMDPEWARRNSPFGGTIAYGFLTMSLLTHLFHTAREQYPGFTVGHAGLVFLNYGFNKLRLVSPVPVGTRIRGHFTQAPSDRQTRSGHDVNCFAVRIEIEGQDSPALVADWLSVGIPRAPSISEST